MVEISCGHSIYIFFFGNKLEINSETTGESIPDRFESEPKSKTG